MTTTASPTVDDLLNDARQAWDAFAKAATAGKPTVPQFARYRAALAVADELDKQAKTGPYRAAVARYEQIADEVNRLNVTIASSRLSDGILTAVGSSGRLRTNEERAEQLHGANARLNALAVECGTSEYVPRANDEVSRAHLLHFAEKPRQPSPRRPSSGFEKDYGRAFADVLDKHFTAAEANALAARRQQQQVRGPGVGRYPLHPPHGSLQEA